MVSSFLYILVKFILVRNKIGSIIRRGGQSSRCQVPNNTSKTVKTGLISPRSGLIIGYVEGEGILNENVSYQTN